MRTPLWESSPGALLALLNSTAASELVWCDLFTLKRPDGSELARWSGADVPVTVNGTTWTLGPGIARGRLKRKVGISVDTLEVSLWDAGETVIAGTPLIGYIAQGGFDNIRLEAIRAFKGAADVAVVGTLLDFSGRISQVKPDREAAQLTVRSDIELLDVMVPRDVYQPGCLNTVYDAACGLTKGPLTTAGTAASGTDAARLTFQHTLPAASGYYNLGVVAFTSGANAGISRTVRNHNLVNVTVLSPFPFAVAVGDAFTIYPGCDKKQATCSGKFNNLIRFRGMPYVPTPETVL